MQPFVLICGSISMVFSLSRPMEPRLRRSSKTFSVKNIHNRISICSENVPDTFLSYSIAACTSLSDFARKATYIGLEWLAHIAASDVNTDFMFNLDHPNGLMLVLTNITSHKQATIYNGSESILVFFLGYAPVPDTTACVVTPHTCKHPPY
jgi:hypothetical protein